MSEVTKGPVQQFCSEVWWIVLLRGIALLLFGGLLLTNPATTAILLVQYMGVYFLLDGLFIIYNSIRGRKNFQGWGWGVVMGAMEVVTALLIFSHPLTSTLLAASTLVYCVAFMAIASGILGIFTGIQVRREVEGEWAMIIGGVLAIVLGVLLLMNPRASVKIYLTAMGVFAILGGIMQIATSLRVRKIGKEGIDVIVE